MKIELEIQLSDEDLAKIRAIVAEQVEAAFIRRRDRPLKYYTIKEVAELLKISKPTIGNWMKSGKLKFHKEGNRVLFKEEDLDFRR